MACPPVAAWPTSVAPMMMAVPRATLAAVLVLGAALRVYGLGFGLPFLEARPDEETAIAHAVAIANGDLNPHFFHWPSLTFYLFALVFKAASIVRRLTADDQYLIARGVVALAGTLTILAVHRLARRVAGERTALVAALFLAVAPLHVRDSHFAMTDVLAALLVTASLAALVRAMETRTTPAFASAGLLGGLATSTKYSAVAVVAAFLAAQAGWRWTAVLLAFVVVGFVAATPFAVLDARAFIDGVAFDVTHLSGGHGGDLGVGWLYHLRQTLPLALGWPMFVASLAGFVAMIAADTDDPTRTRRRGAFAVVAFAAVFFLAVGNGRTVFYRYMVPLVPILCVSAACAVTWAFRNRTAPAVWIVAALFALPALVTSVRLDVRLARTDTRVLAGQWLAEHVAPEESLWDAGRTYAEADLSRARFHVWVGHDFDPAANAFTDAGGRIPDWLVLPESPLAVYTALRGELRQLAAKDYVLAHVIRATTGDDHGRYDPQDAFFLPMSGFDAVVRPGPTLLIYRRKG